MRSTTWLRYCLWTLLVTGGACLAWGLFAVSGGHGHLPVPALVDKANISAIPAEVDFESKDNQSTGLVEITLHNSGTAAAKVLEIRTTCGCTMPESLPTDVIEAGQEIRLKVNVTFPSYGVKQSTVIIRTNSTNAPEIRVPLRLHGQKLTPPYIYDSPREIRIQSVCGELPAPKTFQVSCVEWPGEPWLTRFSVPDGLVAVSTPVIVNESAYDDQTVSRDYQATITFLSAGSSETTHFIPLQPVTSKESVRPMPLMTVAWHQVEVLRAAPSSILFTFSVKDSNSEQSRRIALVAEDDSDWAIRSVTSDAPWLHATAAEALEKSQPRQIVVTAVKPDQGTESPKHAVIRIETDHPHRPEILVRVSARLRQ